VNLYYPVVWLINSDWCNNADQTSTWLGKAIQWYLSLWV
jgi:hypothetical protein